jgi:hypothetical protein
MEKVEKDFHISPEKIFTKLVWLHVFVSVLALALCQQFGLKWGPNFDLMHAFMWAGPVGCQVFCAAFYMGASFVAIAAFLPRHELVWVKERSIWVALVVTGASLLFLNTMGSLGAPVLVFVWAVSGYASALVSLWVVKHLRFV